MRQNTAVDIAQQTAENEVHEHYSSDDEYEEKDQENQKLKWMISFTLWKYI